MPEPSPTRRPRRRLRAAVLACFLACGAARGEETEGFGYGLSGFGTLGLVHSNERGADFVTSLAQATGAGHTRPWDFGPDSRLGLQLDLRAPSGWSAVLQVVGQRTPEDNYRPGVEWANVKYQVNPDVFIRAGRIALPVFMISDSRLVGYANPWIRPPAELYGAVPATSNDGADASWRIHVRNATVTLAANVGTSSHHFRDGLTGTAHAEHGLTLTVDYDALTLKALYQASRVDLTSSATDALFGGYASLGSALAQVPGLGAEAAAAARVTSDFSPLRIPLSTIVIGANYDPGSWFVTGEWLSWRARGVLSDSNGAYLSAGYRIRDFTPYATQAWGGTKPRAMPGIAAATLPAPFMPAANQLNAALAQLLTVATTYQSTTSLGVRWDLHRNVDLKVQYDRTRLGAGTYGVFTNVQPGFRAGGNVDLIGIALDFVF